MFSSLYVEDSGQKEEAMHDVAFLESKNDADGFGGEMEPQKH